MSLRALGRHIRPKKLSPKQNVQIYRESEVDLQPDPDPTRVVLAVETGVEKAEEAEYHLQQAINAAQVGASSGKVRDAYIPTPPTIASEVKYDVLYPTHFQQPATYIRSSTTVEDYCTGSSYCMDENDEIALLKINAHLPNEYKPCSDDHFEDVMDFFEKAAKTKQPYATVDNPPVLSLEELEEQFDESVGPSVRRMTKYIYEHWKSRRLASTNHNVQPILKFETGADTDDGDPYVCFRRREIRQIRKTRHRDAQSADKLRRLRKELEEARHLMAMVKQRELIRKEVLAADRTLFKQRADVKETKRKLGIKGDDEDLINQKVPKKKPSEGPVHGLTPPIRFPISGRLGPGDDMRLLDDWYAERGAAVAREIQHNVEKHVRWNEGYVDKTKSPLTPVSPRSSASNADFRKAMPATEYLPTPPASVASESPAVDCLADNDSPSHPLSPPLRYASPAGDDSHQPMPSFRRRLGRGGRVMFDRRIPFRSRDKENSSVAERFKFDSDEEQMDDQPVYDPIESMSERAFLFTRAREADTPHPHSTRRSLNEVAAHHMQLASQSAIGHYPQPNHRHHQ